MNWQINNHLHHIIGEKGRKLPVYKPHNIINKEVNMHACYSSWLPVVQGCSRYFSFLPPLYIPWFLILQLPQNLVPYLLKWKKPPFLTGAAIFVLPSFSLHFFAVGHGTWKDALRILWKPDIVILSPLNRVIWFPGHPRSITWANRKLRFVFVYVLDVDLIACRPQSG